MCLLQSTESTALDRFLCGGIRAIEQLGVFISILFLSITSTKWFLLVRIIARIFTNTGHEDAVTILSGLFYKLTYS